MRWKLLKLVRMQLVHPFLVLALWCAAAAQAAEVVRFHHGNGQLREEFTRNERGNKHGPAREFGSDGKLLRESTYEDGREVGVVRSFHPDGSLRRVAFYATPGAEQAYAEFTPGGKLAHLKCGPRAVLPSPADDARWCGFTGPADVELFDASGRVRMRLRYVDGKPVRSESLHPNGQPALTDELVDGSRRVEKRFTAEGRLQREQVWAGGVLATDTSYYLNGQPRSSIEWQRSGDKAQRVVRDFHDNGKVASQGTYLVAARGRSHPVGAHEQFDEQGRKVSETLYDDQGRARRHRSWAADGTLVKDDEIFEDGSRKAFTR